MARRTSPRVVTSILAMTGEWTGKVRSTPTPKLSLRTDVPDFAPGDTLKVHVRVVEGTRERVQIFQGAVIRRQGAGLRADEQSLLDEPPPTP